MASESNAQFGVIGMAVMGRNLALNIIDHGFTVAVFNREPELTDAAVSESRGAHRARRRSLQELVGRARAAAPDHDDDQGRRARSTGDAASCSRCSSRRHRHRRRQLLVRGHARREKAYAAAGLRFVGVGVSGGEEGARNGPSLMPGGDQRGLRRRSGRSSRRSPRRPTRGPCVTHCRSRRRRSLRQDGAQRHRVRRHAAHRGGVRRARSASAASAPGALAEVFAALEPRPARIVPDRDHRAGLHRPRSEDRRLAGRHGARQGRPEGHRQVDRAGRPRARRADPEHRRGDRRARAVEHEGRARARRRESCAARRAKALARGYERPSCARSTTRSTRRRSSPTRRAWS